jgi:hypothetical protein
MIWDSDFNPFSDLNLGVKERRSQSKHGDQTITMRGVQHQHDCSSRRLAWDHGTTVFDNLVVDKDEMDSFLLPYFTLGMLKIGCLEEWSSKELTDFM